MGFCFFPVCALLAAPGCWHLVSCSCSCMPCVGLYSTKFALAWPGVLPVGCTRNKFGLLAGPGSICLRCAPCPEALAFQCWFLRWARVFFKGPGFLRSHLGLGHRGWCCLDWLGGHRATCRWFLLSPFLPWTRSSAGVRRWAAPVFDRV